MCREYFRQFSSLLWCERVFGASSLYRTPITRLYEWRAACTNLKRSCRRRLRVCTPAEVWLMIDKTLTCLGEGARYMKILSDNTCWRGLWPGVICVCNITVLMTSLGDGYRDTEQDPHAGSSHVAASPRSQQLPKRDFERFRRLSEQLFRDRCSRCRFQPYDCVVVRFVE